MYKNNKCSFLLNFKEIIFLIALNLLGSQVIAQSSVEVSKVILPSPNAASLGSFGNNSTGSHNGLPEISIPLFQKLFPNQDGNITLSYDASGTKVAQEATWVGLGWQMDYGGGVISRIIRDKDDLQWDGYHSIDTIPSQAVFDDYYNSHGASDPYGRVAEYLQQVATGQVDTEPDIFSFSFGGHNGKFVLDKIKKGSGILQLEESNLKIVYTDPGWIIIDGDGNKYYFNTRERSQNWSNTMDSEINAPPGVGEFASPYINTAWYLDSIVTAKLQRINFTYSGEYSLSPFSKSEQSYHMLQLIAGCPNGNPQPHFYSASQQIRFTPIPQSIVFPNGSIEFHTATREDVKDVDGNNGSVRLDYILEKDKDGGTLKKMQFYYSYFNNNDLLNRRLKLDSLQDITNPIHPLPSHRMSYYNPEGLPSKTTKAIDHWGYYTSNGYNNMGLLTPALITQPIIKSFPGAYRIPDTTLASVQNGVLSSLTYPTKGTTNFIYELNEYTNLFGNDQWELKDTSIVLAAEPGEARKTETFTITEPSEVSFYFDFTDLTNPGYRDEFVPNYAFLDFGGQEYFSFRNMQYPPLGSMQDVTQETLILTPGTYTLRLDPALHSFRTIFIVNYKNQKRLAQRKGGGLRIKKIENFDGTGQKTVKRFLYNKGSLSTGLVIAPVSYDYITSVGGTSMCGNVLTNYSAFYLVRSSSTISLEGFTRGGLIGYSKVTELNGENGENGKTEYFFHNHSPSNVQAPNIPYTNDALNGKMLNAKIYDSENVLRRKTENEYEFRGRFRDMPGMHLLSFPWTTSGYYTTIYSNGGNMFYPNSREVVKDYIGTDSVTTEKKYFYEGDVPVQISKMTEISSKGDTYNTTYQYPGELMSPSGHNVYNSMNELNIISPVIEKTVDKNGEVLSSEKVNYDYWKNGSWGDNSSNLILPKLIETKQGIANPEPRISFKAYDNSGNILGQSISGGPDLSYVWGYNGQYPIAEVKNAKRNDIFYEGFEEVTGNTAINDARTGHYSYNGSYSKALSGLDNGKYTLTYWQKNGGWSMHTTAVDVINTTYTLNISGQIDDISFHPVTALLTSYTYDPLVGMTSTTDPKGTTIFYEYDSFQRLKFLRDQNRNIVKSYDYHYKP